MIPYAEHLSRSTIGVCSLSKITFDFFINIVRFITLNTSPGLRTLTHVGLDVVDVYCGNLCGSADDITKILSFSCL